MKKTGFLVLVMAGTLFLSCDTEYDYKVINDSSRTVEFKFSIGANSNLGPYTLHPGQSDTYFVRSVQLEYYKAVPKTVYYQFTDQYTGRFIDYPPVPLKILNTTGKKAILTAVGCMDSEPIPIPDATPVTNHSIYTTAPEFSAFLEGDVPDVYNFPAPVIYDYSPATGIMSVTIHG